MYFRLALVCRTCLWIYQNIPKDILIILASNHSPGFGGGTELISISTVVVGYDNRPEDYCFPFQSLTNRHEHAAYFTVFLNRGAGKEPL